MGHMVRLFVPDNKSKQARRSLNMTLSLSLFTVFLLAECSSAAKYSRTVTYEGQLVIRCGVESERIGYLLSHDEVDVWSVTADHADIRLNNSLFQKMRIRFPECSVLHSSVESLVQEFEQAMEQRSKANTSLDWFEEYHEYEEIVNWYEQLAEEYSDIAKYEQSIGKSIEGRDQPALHIKSGSPSFKIYFQCQIQGRDWISGATCMYIAKCLLENHQNDEVNEMSEKVTEILKEVEFIFIPMVNPDGYQYAWSNDRLWRKNRQVNSGSSCRGVDLNRNYDDHWNQGGSSANPCSETYHGTSAASEPETQNTQNYFKNQGNIIGTIDWRSYGQLILRPYGWTTEDSPDEAQLCTLGNKMSDDIFGVHGKSYTSQKSIGLYKATGTASDWFYSDKANVNNDYRAAAFTFELRDTGQYGFLLPPDQIVPTGEEMIPAVLDFAEELMNYPLKK